MIHLFEPDPRFRTDPTFPENHGSFSVINYGLNDALKKLGRYGEETAEWFGLATSLDLQWRVAGRKNFKIVVWELTNTLPYRNINLANKAVKQLDESIFGMSDQITNLYNKHDVACRTLHCGCDTDFYHSVAPKHDVFTFCHVNSSNLRSGLDLTLQAYDAAFRNNMNVRLIVKDTYDSPKLKTKVGEFIRKGNNIFYFNERWTKTQIRELYSRSQVCLNLLRMTSWGFPLAECSACGCLSVTGDFNPTNVLNRPEYSVLIKPSKEISISELEKQIADYGLHNGYTPFSYPEEPRIFDFDLDEYIATLKEIYENWDNKYSKIDTRTPIVNNFKWEDTAKQLIKYLDEAV